MKQISSILLVNNANVQLFKLIHVITYILWLKALKSQNDNRSPSSQILDSFSKANYRANKVCELHAKCGQVATAPSVTQPHKHAYLININKLTCSISSAFQHSVMPQALLSAKKQLNPVLCMLSSIMTISPKLLCEGVFPLHNPDSVSFKRSYCPFEKILFSYTHVIYNRVYHYVCNEYIIEMH